VSSELSFEFKDDVCVPVASNNEIATNKIKNKRRIDMTNLLRSKFHETWGLIILEDGNTSRDIKNLEDWRNILWGALKTENVFEY